METSIIILRFSIVFFLALLFGAQRQKSHKPIGFGTFIFVSLGACALSLIAIHLNITTSVSLVAAIVTSIGFLGAGALIKTSDKIFGFTTAASIWIFAIFGLAIGLGYYLIGILSYLFIWIVIVIDLYLEINGIGSYQKKIQLVSKKKIDENKLRQILHSKKQKLLSIELNKKEKKVTYNYIVQCSGDDLKMILDDLEKTDLFISYKVE